MNKHVLVIEDSAIIRKLLRMTLQLAGYQVSETSNGLDGVGMASELKPDVVLLDLMMPGAIDGLEVCRRMRQDPSLASTPVLMLTAKGQEADKLEGLAAGATEYLIKPFEPDNLLKMISRHTPAPPA